MPEDGREGVEVAGELTREVAASLALVAVAVLVWGAALGALWLLG